MDKKHDNSPENWSQDEQRANYLDQTMKFTTEDLERERLRLREESRDRFRERHESQPLDGDYFDEKTTDNGQPEEEKKSENPDFPCWRSAPSQRVSDKHPPSG